MTLIDFVRDLANPDLAFLAKALVVTVIAAIVCGIVGCYVVLRQMAFIGDAVAHAVFPGVAIAFVTQGSLLLGGAIAGIVTSILIALFSHYRRLGEDTVIGVFFVAAFALGVVVMSRAQGYGGSIQDFLFGSITGIGDRDVIVIAVGGLVVLAVLATVHRQLVMVSLDREMAQAMGLSLLWLDIVLHVGVTIAVVVSIQTIGNILVLALLVTPAAAARLLTQRLGVMMALAPTFAAASAFIGLYLSWSYDLPVGATVVLVATAVFFAALLWSSAQRRSR